ncbi:unnamed protein product [Lactuca saligna]|uniref:Uncharacterized protein n=1 Tax=Lactuca saligna TaxID=75948 RepID=A0AA35V6Y6_LACSI|nr:unnamed protein product [Lactuca saligna]
MFAGFDAFERSLYFGPSFDLGQFERFRRIFHHSTYRVLLNHKERSTLNVEENGYKQRVWIRRARPEEEETFQFTIVQIIASDPYTTIDNLFFEPLSDLLGYAQRKQPQLLILPLYHPLSPRNP